MSVPDKVVRYWTEAAKDVDHPDVRDEAWVKPVARCLYLNGFESRKELYGANIECFTVEGSVPSGSRYAFLNRLLAASQRP